MCLLESFLAVDEVTFSVFGTKGRLVTQGVNFSSALCSILSALGHVVIAEETVRSLARSVITVCMHSCKAVATVCNALVNKTNEVNVSNHEVVVSIQK